MYIVVLSSVSNENRFKYFYYIKVSIKTLIYDLHIFEELVNCIQT